MMQQVLTNPRVSDLSDTHRHKLFYQELQQTGVIPLTASSVRASEKKL